MIKRKDILEKSLDRGITLRRIRKALQNPIWAIRNARYHIFRTTSNASHVFVIGPPRSGTTLMQMLLRAHPNFAGLDGETRFFFRRNYLDLSYPEISKEDMTVLLDGARDAVDLFDKIAERVVASHGAKRFIEKTPEHALRLQFLMQKYPNAKFVFMVRDPRDGYLSALRNPNVKANTIKLYSELWKRSVQVYLSMQNHSKRMMLVRYEDLCQSPETVVSSVMEFLSESLDYRQQDPLKYVQTSTKNEEGHQRIIKPISDKTVGQWRTALTTEETELFDQLLGKWMEKMGYEAGEAKAS